MPSLSRNSTLIPLIVACALFMENLDGSIIATALPSIARSLHADPLHLNLAITSYMFSLAVFIPLSGWVADRYGARTVFRAAIIVFTLGSICCGLSDSLWQLIGSRVLQGIGGAMMVPVGRLVMLRAVPRNELVGAMAWLTTPAMIGPVLGPPVGGFIVTYSSWRWIFFVNVPIGLLGILLTTIFIANIREEKSERLDLLGFMLMALSLGGLVFGFETLGRDLLPGNVVTGLLIGGAVCLALYVVHTRRIKHPIIDLGLLKLQTYRASIVGGSLFRVGIGALPFLLPLMLQYGFGLTPATSGLLTFASAAGALLMKMTATPIIRKFGFRTVLVGNTVLNTLFLAGCALFQPNTAHAVIFAFLLMGGFFRSLQFTSLNTVAYAEVPNPLISRANTLYSMMQQLSLSMGVATGALFLNLTLAWNHTTTLGAQEFWPSYLGVGAISLTALFFFLPLSPHAGAELSGRVQGVASAKHDDPA